MSKLHHEELMAVNDLGSIILHKEMRTSNLPIWLEAGVFFDWFMLHTAPVYYGLGVPHGDDAGVVLIPGFMGTDIYLWEMNLWLRRVGYRPFMSDIGWNADCLNSLVNRLMQTIVKASDETGRKVHLIGHSLGGVLARSAAVRMQDRVASIISLGSPFRGICAHPIVFVTVDRVRENVRRRNPEDLNDDCFTSVCSCDTVSSLAIHLPIDLPHLAVYTKTDGIVDWRVCTHDDPKSNVEVQGTHIGLVFNHQVYSLVAENLARVPALDLTKSIPSPQPRLIQIEHLAAQH